jgi:hypothetical protein
MIKSLTSSKATGKLSSNYRLTTRGAYIKNREKDNVIDIQINPSSSNQGKTSVSKFFTESFDLSLQGKNLEEMQPHIPDLQKGGQYTDIPATKLAIKGKVKVSKLRPYSLYTSKEGISFYANSELMFRTKLLKFYNCYNKVSYWFKGKTDSGIIKHMIVYYPLTSIEEYNKFNGYTLKELTTFRNHFLVNELTPHLCKVFKRSSSKMYLLYREWAKNVYSNILAAVSKQKSKLLFVTSEYKTFKIIPMPIFKNKTWNKTLYNFFKKKLNYNRDFKAHKLDKIEIKVPKRLNRPSKRLIYKINYIYPEYIVLNDIGGILLEKAVYTDTITYMNKPSRRYSKVDIVNQIIIFVQGYSYRELYFYVEENESVLSARDFFNNLMFLHKKPIKAIFINHVGSIVQQIVYTHRTLTADGILISPTKQTRLAYDSMDKINQTNIEKVIRDSGVRNKPPINIERQSEITITYDK